MKLHSKVFKRAGDAEDFADKNLYDYQWSGIHETSQGNFRIIMVDKDG